MLREGRLRRHKLHIPRADFSLKSQPSSIPLRLLSHQCPYRGTGGPLFAPPLTTSFPHFCVIRNGAAGGTFLLERPKRLQCRPIEHRPLICFAAKTKTQPGGTRRAANTIKFTSPGRWTGAARRGSRPPQWRWRTPGSAWRSPAGREWW